MTTYSITAAQRDSLLASRLQHVDRGDSGAAKALDWALALQPAATASDDAEQEALYRVAINCPHEIDRDKIVLHFDPKQPGHNALNQLGRRLKAAVRRWAQAI